jgi:hypothetical protein
MADLTTLYDLCSQALQAQQAEAHEREAEALADDRAAAIKHATEAAATLFGETAAAALGEWRPLDAMAEDAYQAYVQLTPHAYLQYTVHFEDGRRMELISHCPRCGHDRTVRVGSLEQLATAINEAGLR